MLSRLKSLFGKQEKSKPNESMKSIPEQKKCPPSCFLVPKESLTLQYPICDSNCNMDCNKLKLAMIHAHEWKHDEAAQQAYKLLKDHFPMCLNESTQRKPRKF